MIYPIHTYIRLYHFLKVQTPTQKCLHHLALWFAYLTWAAHNGSLTNSGPKLVLMVDVFAYIYIYVYIFIYVYFFKCSWMAQAINKCCHASQEKKLYIMHCMVWEFENVLRQRQQWHATPRSQRNCERRELLKLQPFLFALLKLLGDFWIHGAPKWRWIFESVWSVRWRNAAW